MTHYPTENAARRAVIDACLKMNDLGINQGKSGNVSVRWARGDSDGYLITPTGLPYEETREDDICWLSLTDDPERPAGNPVLEIFPHAEVPQTLADQRLPSSEWRMHAAIYREQGPDVAGAVVHAHSLFATTLACLPQVQRQGIPAFHYMIAVAGGDSIRCAPYRTFGTEALCAVARTALVDRKACLLGNHGQLAYHRDLTSALALAQEVETLSRMYWQTLQVGGPGLIDVREMARVLEKFRTYGQPSNVRG